MKEICAFCGKKKKTESTSIVEAYCIDCHRINIGQSEYAIREIQNRTKSNKAIKPDPLTQVGGDR